jgi:hypothetical protein
MSSLRLLSAIALVLGVSGCGPLTEFVANSAGLPSPAKRVVDKAPPDVLVADDGSTCHVPPARFERIEPGDHVTCVWSGSRSFRTIPRPRH